MKQFRLIVTVFLLITVCAMRSKNDAVAPENKPLQRLLPVMESNVNNLSILQDFRTSTEGSPGNEGLFNAVASDDYNRLSEMLVRHLNGDFETTSEIVHVSWKKPVQYISVTLYDYRVVLSPQQPKCCSFTVEKGKFPASVPHDSAACSCAALKRDSVIEATRFDETSVRESYATTGGKGCTCQASVIYYYKVQTLDSKKRVKQTFDCMIPFSARMIFFIQK